MKEKRNIKNIFQIVFTFFAFFIFGAINVDAETVSVSTFDELKAAFDGVKLDDAGNKVSDTSITDIKLGSNIIVPAEENLYFKVINDITLDLNGYVIDADANNKHIYVDYGSNGVERFFDASLTITDNSLSQTGAIKLKNEYITINQYNLEDGNKNYKFTINGGKFYSDNLYLISIYNQDYYWKNQNITFDFKINKGYFKLAAESNDGEILLAQGLKEQNVKFSFLFDNLTLDAPGSKLIGSSGTGSYTINEGIPADTDFYIYSSTGEEVLINDRTIKISNQAPTSYYSSFPNEKYMGIKLIRKQGLSINVPVFDSADYGYASIDAKPMTIINKGTSNLKIKNVTIYGTDFIINDGDKVGLAGGEENLSWKIKPKDGLEVGVHTATITIEDENGSIYTSKVSFEVKEVISTEPVTKEVNELNDFIKLMNNSEGVDTIKLGADIVSTDETLADVYTSFIWYIRGDKVLDLNGHTITGIVDRVFKLYYYGDYTVKIIDSSKSCTSAIINNYNGYNGGIFTLNSLDSGRAANKTLIIDGVNLTENGIDNPKSIYNSKENSTLDTLIVKNSNIKSVTLALWFDKYEFSNITLKPSDVNKQTRLLGEAETTVKVSDILGVDQEIVYDKKINEAPTYEKFVVEDTNTLIKDIYTQNNNEEDERSIVIRYKKGFEVSDVEFDDVVYGYSPIDKEILIKNIGVSKATIESVKSSDENFIVTGVENKDVEAGSSDNSWKIKPREGLDAGVYTADIKVITADGNTYTSTVKITVNKKDLTGLGISLNSPYAYGSAIEPELTGTTVLGSNEYKFVYSTSDGEELLDKPFKLGEYKVTLKVNSKNYNASDVTVDFSIVQKNINTTIKVEGIKDYTFKRIAIYQDDLVVKDGDKELNENFDYKLEYSDNINAGEATITINPVSGSNYTFDSFTETFKIKPADLLDEFVSLEKDTYGYTGSNINPPVTLRDTVLSVYLTERLDYEIRYENNVEKGNEAKVIITGKGNYKGTVTKPFSIVDKEVQEISFTDSEITKTYGEGVFTIEANHTKGDGVVKYTSSNTDVAVVNESTGEVTIKGAGTAIIKATASETETCAEASASYKLNVNKLKINFTAIVDSKEYDGNNKANVSKIDFIGVKSYDTLVKDTDYTVSALFSDENYGLSKDVTVKITLKDTKTANNYELENDTYNAEASITGKVIKGEWATVAEDTYTYNGSGIEPVVTVKDPTGETVITLTKGTHYRVEYTDNTNAGKGKIKITGIGNYSGEIEKEFTINKKSINPTIDDIPSVIYNGSEHRPSLVVKDGSTTLGEGTDYNVEYSNNLRAGSAYAEISSVPTSNYTFDTKGKSFTIEKYEIKASDVTLEYTSVVGDGNAKRPNVTVKMGNEVIEPNEYNIDYSNNTNVGTAKVIVIIKADSDDFTGTVTKTFKIVDKTLLTISGISNQQVVYTGSPVVLNGTLTVSNGIKLQDLTVKWYKGSEEITRPTDAGEYKVVYSYEDDDYIGSLTVDFEITKKESVIPTLNDYSAVVGDKLSSITLPNGFKWRDGNEVITLGSKKYNATYTENNDTTNYTTKNVEVNVYGKVKVNLTTSVNGVGGTISSSKNNILEGTTETITLSPSVGFEISKVEVNGIDKTSSINNNKLDIVIGNSDVNVVVTYKAIQYTITINDLEHVTINPSGIIKVDYNTNKTFTIMAELGYKLVSVKVNGVEMISSIVNDELTLENILSDTEIVVVVERNIHKVIEGANQEYIINESKEARFKIDARNYSFERGGSVYVDGVLVDPDNYTSEDGNIIVLKKKYLDKLSEGEHTLKVVFVDGEASTTFSVVKLNKENPKTGDNIVIYILAGIVSTLGLAGVYFYRRKQTN